MQLMWCALCQHGGPVLAVHGVCSGCCAQARSVETACQMQGRCTRHDCSEAVMEFALHGRPCALAAGCCAFSSGWWLQVNKAGVMGLQVTCSQNLVMVEG